jgi:ankyrin repeat protein
VDDKTLFMAAAAQVPRHPKLIDLLGDPAVATSRGVNALHFASRYCSKTVIREIISRAPGLVESQDASGAAPVAHAIVAGRSRGVVEMLAGGGHIVGIKGYNVFGHIINTARYDLMGIFNDLPRLRADKMLARANADGAPDWVLRTLWRGMAPADIIPIVLNRVNLVAELAQAECTICSRPSTDMFVNTICGHSHLCGECVARITTCPCCNAAHAYIRMY